MELLKKMNDQIWTLLFQITKPITDNIAFDIIILCVFVAIGITFVRIKILKKFAYAYGPFDFLITLSTAYAMQRLPMIHMRIHTALATTTSVLSSSVTYLGSFNKISGLQTHATKEIASFLYELPVDQYAKWKEVAPTELYQHLLHTLSSIRSMGIFGQVHLPSFGTWNLFLIIVLIVLGITFLTKLGNKWACLLFLVQASVIIYSTSLNRGATLAALTLWGTEAFILQMFTPEARNLSQTKEQKEKKQ